MVAARKLSDPFAPPSAARSSAQVDASRRTFGTFRCVESLPTEKPQFETRQSLASDLPERLAVYLSGGLVGLYVVAFLAQFVARYIGM